MPKKSFRSRLARSQRSDASNVFVSTKEVQDEREEIWCSDDELCPIPSFLIDDADIEHSEDDEEKDEEFELNVPDM